MRNWILGFGGEGNYGLRVKFDFRIKGFQLSISKFGKGFQSPISNFENGCQSSFFFLTQK